MLIVIPKPSHRTVLGKIGQVMLKYNVGKSVAPKEIMAQDIEVIYGDGTIRVKSMRARYHVLNKYEQLKEIDR